VIIFFGESEISQFPLAGTIPTPIPEEPTPVSVPNRLDVVERVRAEYPDKPSLPQVGEMLNKIAWEVRADGFGLSRKPSGEHMTHQPGTGIPIAGDILHHQPTDTLIDVFIGWEDGAKPTWGATVHHNDPARPWIPAVEPLGTTIPDPPIEEPQEPEENGSEAILARLRAIQEAVTKLSKHLGVPNVV
jgi:hypothetical protein